MPRTINPARTQTPIPAFRVGGNVSTGQYGQPGDTANPANPATESARQARIRARRAYFRNPTGKPTPAPGDTALDPTRTS